MVPPRPLFWVVVAKYDKRCQVPGTIQDAINITISEPTDSLHAIGFTRILYQVNVFESFATEDVRTSPPHTVAASHYPNEFMHDAWNVQCQERLRF